MKHLWLSALLALSIPASAQTPSPAQMGLDKSAATGNLSVLDRSGTWVPLGPVNSTTHTFSQLFQEGGTGSVARTVTDKLNEQAISVKDFGAKCDAYVSYNFGFSGSDAGSITSGSTTFTVYNYSFTSADIGKKISIHGAGAAGAVLGTTIASIVSTHVVQLATAASTTVSNKNFSLGTDDTTAIQNAINWAAQSPSTRIVEIPPNAICGVAYPGLSISTSYIQLRGYQTGTQIYNTTYGIPKVVSGLAWIGGEYGIILIVEPTTTATSTELNGVVIENLGLAANNLSTFGMTIAGVRSSTFSNIYCHEATSSCIDIGGKTLSPLAGYCGVQFSRFSNISGAQIVASGRTIRSLGDPLATCNSSVNLFTQIFAISKDGPSFTELGGDNNVWQDVGIYNVGGSATYGFYFGTEGGYPANNHTINHYSANLPAFFDAGTYGNVISLDKGNGAPDSIGTGLYVQINGADNATIASTQKGQGQIKLGVGDTQGAASTATLDVTSESLRVVNGASNHIRLSDGTSVWGLNIDGTQGNLRFSRITGSGGVNTIGQGIAVSSLPTCNSGALGTQYLIIDGAASLAWGATVTGGGSAKYLVWCNADNWTVFGK